MKTAIYLRKSRSEEVDITVEDTLKRHKEQLLEFARNNRLNIVEIYEEVVSGDSLYARPKMLQLLGDVENGVYEAVLCMDIDRLGRGAMSEQGIILETFKRSNTKIITPRKIYDLNNDLDETYSEFETFIARQELKQIKRRFQRGIQKSLHDGGYISNAPYGYVKTRKNKLPSLAIVEEEAYYVRMIFDMYVNQGIGSHTIAETISDLGAKPHRSERFGRTSVRKILRNPVYIGQIIWNQKSHIRKGTKGNEKTIIIYNKPDKWVYVDGIHSPIIDEDTFQRAQEILKGRYHPPYYKGVIENPLAGIIKCGNCGYSMQRRLSGKEPRMPYLVCFNKGCMPSAQHAFVEQRILSFIHDYLDNIEIQMKKQKPQDTTVLERALYSIQKEQELVETQKTKLHDLLEQGIYDVDTFLSRASLLNEKSNALKSQETAQIDAISRANRSSNVIASKKIRSVLEAYSSASAQEKNMMLKSIIEEVIYSKEKRTKPHDFSLFIKMKTF